MNLVISNFNIDKIGFSNLYTMKYLHDYLDNDWNISKTKNTYVLKKDTTKLIVNTDVTNKHECQYNDDINTSKNIE